MLGDCGIFNADARRIKRGALLLEGGRRRVAASPQAKSSQNKQRNEGHGGGNYDLQAVAPEAVVLARGT